MTERVLIAVGKEDSGVKIEPGLEINKDTFKMKLLITNNSGLEVTINHSSSQKYNFVLLDFNRKVLYNWAADKMFAQMLTSTVIAAGKTVEFAEELDMETYGAILNRAEYMKAYIVGQSDSFTISKDGYELVLRSF